VVSFQEALWKAAAEPGHLGGRVWGSVFDESVLPGASHWILRLLFHWLMIRLLVCWLMMRLRWMKAEHGHVVTWVAVYGDLFSMSLFFPALLIGFFVYSSIG